MAKSCTSVFLAGKFLFGPSDNFAVGCIVYPLTFSEQPKSLKNTVHKLGYKLYIHLCNAQTLSCSYTNDGGLN